MAVTARCKCGAAIEPGAVFCVECGTNLRTGAQAAPSEIEGARPRGRREPRVTLIVGWTMAGISMAVMAAIVVILIAAPKLLRFRRGWRGAERGAGDEVETAGFPDTGSEASEAPVPVGPDDAGQGRAAASSSGAGPEIVRVEAGAMTVDGLSDDWVANRIKLFPALPPRPIRGEPRDRGEEFRLKMWSHQVQSAEVRAMALAHDGTNLYVMLALAEGIKERFERTRSTGALGYLYLDVDGDASTGRQRTVHQKAGGFDCRLWLPTGFYGGTGKATEPMAAYKVQRYSGKGHEDVPGSERETHKDPEFVAFAGKFLEMRIPLEMLGIEPPTELKIYFDPMGLAGESALMSLRIE